jgi:hypothetical protein
MGPESLVLPRFLQRAFLRSDVTSEGTLGYRVWLEDEAAAFFLGVDFLMRAAATFCGSGWYSPFLTN